jgi:hypothetical protein
MATEVLTNDWAIETEAEMPTVATPEETWPLEEKKDETAWPQLESEKKPKRAWPKGVIAHKGLSLKQKVINHFFNPQAKKDVSAKGWTWGKIDATTTYSFRAPQQVDEKVAVRVINSETKQVLLEFDILRDRKPARKPIHGKPKH